MRLPIFFPLLVWMLFGGGGSVAQAASKGQSLATVRPRITAGTATARLPSCQTPVRYDARMVRAATIAQSQAWRHSVKRCWRFVKCALVAAEVVGSYPKTPLAKQAASELPQRYGVAAAVRVPKDPGARPV